MLFKKGRIEDKDVIYVSIKEALSSEGCPICRLLRKLEVEAIENLLYEHVLDPQVRSELRRNLGFCNYHSWLLVDYVLKNPWVGQLGVSIIYEDLLSTYLSKLGNPNAFKERTCELCRRVKYFEETYVNAFAKYLKTLNLMSEYRKSPSVLCDKHLRQVINLLPKDVSTELINVQKAKLESILNKLRSFIRKQDYRVKEEVSTEEAKAWRVAVEVLVGGNTSANAVLSKYSVDKDVRNYKHDVGGALKRLFHR